MTETSLKDDAVCPRCQSTRIRSGATIADKDGLRGSNRLPIDDRISVALDNYMCLDCGYSESYISDRGILNRITRQWHKVTPEARHASDDNT